MTEVLPPTDYEVGRFALRSFRLQMEHQSDEIGARLGWWTDGYARVWRPIGHHDGWLDGTCEAECLMGRKHQAPDEDCSCGVYASLSYADLLDQYRSAARDIVAVIAAQGVTIIGTRGLRTQFARVVAYWTSPAPYHHDVASRQFAEAKMFDCPLEMIDAYGLALLPPPDEPEDDLGLDRISRLVHKFWTS